VEDRRLPYDEGAEQNVVGALMLERDAIIKVADALPEEDFYFTDCRLIYGAILALYNERIPPDLTTVRGKLMERGHLEEVGGASRLAQFLTTVTAPVHIQHHIAIIKDHALRRRIIAAGESVSNMAYTESGVNVKDLLERAQQTITGVTQEGQAIEFVSLAQALETYFEKLDKIQETRGEVSGIPTGFYTLDQMTGGFQPSDLIVLAARPGVGKTSLAMGCGVNAARAGKRVAVVSLEMPVEQLLQRMLAMETGIDSHRLRMGNILDEEWEKLSRAFGMLAELPMLIDDSSALSIIELQNRVRRLHADQPLDFLIVDYLGLLSGTRQRDNRVQELGQVSHGLKALAKELHIPVLVLAQLSRGIEHRGGDEFRLSDLRDSGEIEQDADVVIFIGRKEEEGDESDKSIATLVIKKHRNGPTGNIDMLFWKNLTKFTNLEQRYTNN
jgi:replicative DNA helicase